MSSVAPDQIGSALQDIQKSLQDLRRDYQVLANDIDSINGKVNVLSSVKQIHSNASSTLEEAPSSGNGSSLPLEAATPALTVGGEQPVAQDVGAPNTSERRQSITSRIILTTYPGQSGIEPVRMSWGDKDFVKRGPVVVSRQKATIRRRNGKRIYCCKVYGVLD